METEAVSLVLDFAFIIAIWTAASPLLISALKNIGGAWPNWLKQGLSVTLAITGAVVAYAMTASLGSLDVLDFQALKPLVVGAFGAFAAQYAIYRGIWQGTAVETAVANFTPGNNGNNV